MLILTRQRSPRRLAGLDGSTTHRTNLTETNMKLVQAGVSLWIALVLVGLKLRIQVVLLQPPQGGAALQTLGVVEFLAAASHAGGA